MTSGALDSVTILHSLHGISPAKVFRGPNLEKDPRPPNEWHWRVETREFRDLETLHAVLTEVSATPTACVIRGEPLRTTDRNRTRRRKEHFADVPRRWAMLDFDGIAAPEGLDWLNLPTETVAFLQSLLPPAFRGASCRFNYSGSAGTKAGAGIRMHLWFIFDRPVSNAELKAWLGDLKKPEGGRLVDTAPFRQVQPHYTTPPLFLAGARDPIPAALRSGLWRGSRDVVAVGEVAAWHRVRQRREAAPPVDVASAPRSLSPAGGGGFEFHLSQIGDHAGGFHEPASRAVGAWFAARRGRDLEEAELLLRLTDAMRAAPVRPGDEREAERQQRIADLTRLIADIKRAELSTPAAGRRCDPPVRPPDAPLDDVRSAVGDAAATFATTVSLPAADPSQRRPVVIATGTGSGKTEAALREGLKRVSQLPRQGRKAAPSIIYFAQQHQAASEVATRGNSIAAELGIIRRDGGPIVKAYRGATQPDADRSDKYMCRRPLELIEAARAVGCGVHSLCRNCPHHPRRAAPEDACAYRQQFDPEVRVWVLQHAMLSSPPPRDFRRLTPVAVVIDEAPWQTLLGELRLPASVFDSPPTLEQIRSRQRKNRARRWWKSAPDPEATHLRLSAVYAGMCAAIASVQDGPLTRDDLVKADLRPEDVHWAAQTVRWLFPPPSPSGGGNNARLLRDLGRMRRSGRARGAQLTQALETVAATLRNDADDAASPIRLVTMDKSRAIVFGLAQDVHSTWSALPTMLLDATYNETLGERWLPGARVAAQLRVREDPEAVRRVQVYDSAFGKTSFDDPKGAGATVAYHSVERLIRILHFRAGKVYVETYKGVAERLRSDLGDGPGLTVSNFGASRGVDAFGDVAVSLVVGRPLPGAYELAAMAELTTGRQVPRLSQLPKDRPSAIAMRDGSGVIVSEAYHPAPVANAWKRQIANAAVEQAEGRCRAAMRTPGNPVLSLTLTNTVTNLDIDLAISREQLFGAITVGAELAAKGIIPDMQADAAKVLGATHDAFRQRLSRGGAADTLGKLVDVGGTGPEPRTGDALDIFHVLGDPPVSAFGSFRRFAYKMAKGAKPRRHHVLIDVTRHPDVRAALEAVLGPLALFEPAEPPQWLAATLSASHSEGDVEKHAAPVSPSDAVIRMCGTLAGWEPSEWMAVAPTAFVQVVGTDYRECATVPVLPPAMHVFRVHGSAPVDVHCFDDAGAFTLRRTLGAAWPPQEDKPTAVAPPSQGDGRSAETYSLPDVARALGKPAEWPRALAASPRVRRHGKQAGIGLEKAILAEMCRRVGPEKFAAAVAKLTGGAS